MSDAYSIVQDLPATPRQEFRVPMHYLLYASAGAMRLEAEGQVWSLPPARAALILADHPIAVTLPQKMSLSSAVFAPDFVPAPALPLRVFEMTPLARELVLACRAWPQGTDLDDTGRLMFRTLAAVTWTLAQSPSPAVMPAGQSQVVRDALRLTQADLENPPDFATLAGAVAVTPRTLARRFSAELGMTWRQVLRRLRMIRAIELMAESDAGITQIALSVGYSSLSAFNASFRDFTGQSPSDFRAGFRP